MRSSTDHVKMRGDAVDRVADEKDRALRIEHRVAAAFRVMSLDDHDPLVSEALAGQSTQHEILIELQLDVSVSAGDDAQDLLEVGAKQGVAAPRKARHQNCVLIRRSHSRIKKLGVRLFNNIVVSWRSEKICLKFIK